MIVPVMQVVDTLVPGGLERVAVNIANEMPRERYSSHMCTTRSMGRLQQALLPDVGQLHLHRGHRIDLGALVRMIRYIRAQRIQILHAHGSAIAISAVVSRFPPFPAVVWHDHFGRYAVQSRSVLLYRFLTSSARAIISVNHQLARWATQQLKFPAERVWYVPNFVVPPPEISHVAVLPGYTGMRIVCVANLRPQKDHTTLIRAMELVVREHPKAQLILVGEIVDKGYWQTVQKEIASLHLNGNVTSLGIRDDVQAILKGCDIGVLSSASEGLPLALIEYGMAGLPAIATRVGQCEEVLDKGDAGILVPPQSPGELAEGICALLSDPPRRARFADRFRKHITKHFSAHGAINIITEIYERAVEHE
jgi:glycosyltransferase involved in cell wall biosynthesis